MRPAVDSPRPVRLRSIQRLVGSAILRRLTPEYTMQPTWIDGRPAAAVAETVIKPNDRLSSFERLEIYNRQYWFRLIDVLHDDFPGLRAVVGPKRFQDLVIHYLEAHPSKSFTMRNLGRHLPAFLASRPDLTAPHTAAALEIARLEWAHTEAYDGPTLPAVTLADLQSAPPDRLRLALQPHMTLLDLHHAMDDFLMHVKRACRHAGHDEIPAVRRRPIRKRTRLVVHRHANTVYYKPLPRAAFTLLTALDAGRPLASALADASAGPRPPAAPTVAAWFRLWTSLGWFRRPESA